jgi:hypothetical protein
MKKNTLHCGFCVGMNGNRQFKVVEFSKEINFNKGDKVRLPNSYTYANRQFKVVEKTKDGYVLIFLGGQQKESTYGYFQWWELRKVLKK